MNDNGITRKAARFFPASSNGEFGLPLEMAPVIDRGEGCRVWAADGREFLDYTMAWGAALVGHARREVLDAASRQAAKGANFAAINTPSVLLAERIASLCPAVEKIRFVASGTEATLLCTRVAIAATGRRKILKFEGAYHGQHPLGVTSLVGSEDRILPQSDGSGAGAPWVEQDVLAAPFNDLEGTRRIIEAHATELAGIIVEPLHRCLAPLPGFLQGLRELASRHGIILIFDEVVTGFRLAPGGAQEFYGVIPDLVAYGKALGGGFPLGAYGGRTSIMEVVEEHRLPGPRYAWSASTTGGNPVSCAAALATLDILGTPETHHRLRTLGEYFRSTLGRVLNETSTAGQVLGAGPLAQVAFTDQPVVDHRGWKNADRKRSRAVMLELFRNGIFLNPMGTKLYLSLAHSEAEIDSFAERFKAALLTTNASAENP